MTCSRNDDKRAWDNLVERYAPLVWSICRRHELSDADDADVNQNVWLQLMSQLDQIGHPAALPGWVATATRRECVRVRRAAPGPHAAGYLPDAQAIPDQHAEMAEQELLTAERHAALRGALARLPPRCQQLIGMLIEDPPVPDAQISAALSIRSAASRRAPPLPGQAARRSGNRRPDQHRRPPSRTTNCPASTARPITTR